MGCGVSSINASDSSHSMPIASMPTFNRNENQRHLHDLDLREELRKFNSTENAIQSMEDTKCFEKYRIIQEDLEHLKEQLQENIEIGKQIDQRINDIIETRQLVNTELQEMLIERWSQKGRPKSTEMILIELLSEKEVADLRIELLKKELDDLEAQQQQVKMVCNELENLFQQRDSLLAKIFDDKYGNEKEMQLYKELDELMEEKHYIEMAKIRWLNADNLLLHALKYLDMASDNLHQYEVAPESEASYRYTCILEARNSLVLYCYNMRSLQNMLHNVKLPHLKREDLVQLERRTRELLNSTLSDNETRLRECDQFVQTLRGQTVTQHKWINEVLNGTIKRDLQEMRERCQRKSHELHLERVSLIKHKIDQLPEQSEPNGGPKHDSPLELRDVERYDSEDASLHNLVDSGVDSELDETTVAEEQIARLLASGKESAISSNTPLLPGEQLAPIPTDREVFGRLVQLRNKHNREVQQFEYNQTMTRARVSQGLKDKLNARRSHRTRLEMHRRQLEALQESPLNSVT